MFLTSSVDPIYVFDESNISSDQTASKFNGINNVSSFSANFANKPARDYRITLYDKRSLEAAVLSADPIYSYSDDSIGFDHNTHGWSVGFNAYDVERNGNEVNFSIGFNTANLDPFPGGRTVTIVNGVATFSSSSGLGTDLSVGDKVSYAATTGYLAERGDNFTWKIVDNTGVIKPNITGASVTSINRTFNTIDDISGGGVNPLETEIGNRDLVANDYNLFIWCCDDATDDTPTGTVLIQTWTTDVYHRFRVASPYNTRTQCERRHRHAGVDDGSGYRINYANASVAMTVDINHCHVEGLISNKTANDFNNIEVATSDNCVIEGNIVVGGVHGIDTTATSGKNFVVTNICYNQSTRGISVTEGDIIMCTVVDSALNGIASLDASDLIYSCIVQGSGNSDYVFAGLTQWNISQDFTMAGGTYNDQQTTINFRDAAANDYHLKRSDWKAINRSPSFGIEENDVISAGLLTQYNIYRDIDAEELTLGNYSRGADSIPNLETRELYVSAGVNTDNLKSGINTQIRIINNIATFSEPQVNTNMGIGDTIDYDADNKIAYLREKINDSQWSIGDKFGEPIDDIDFVDLNSITHTFNDLAVMFDRSQPTSIYGFFGDTPNYLYFALNGPKFRLNIPCYRGASPHNQFDIQDFDSDENHYVRLYTPSNIATECNSSQTHNGIRGGATAERVMVDTGNDFPCIDIRDHNVHIDGLVLIGNQTNNDACIDLNHTEGSVITNNICYGAESGIRTVGSLGLDDPIRVDNFDNGIDAVWDTDFKTTWSTKTIHGKNVAYDPSLSLNTFITDPGALFSGSIETQFSIVQGGISEIDDSISIGYHDGVSVVAEVVFTSTSITFNGKTVPIKHIPGREIRCGFGRGMVIQEDGNTADGSSDFFHFTMYDEHNDGIFSNRKEWFKITLGGSSAADLAVVTDGSQSHGLGYLKVRSASDGPAARTVGKSMNNIITNNIVYGHLIYGIYTSGNDTLYNNTIDDCGNVCLDGDVNDVVINNISSRGQIRDYSLNLKPQYSAATDTSIDDISIRNNVDNAAITFVDKVSIFENRDYGLIANDTDVRGKGGNLIGNRVIPFNTDAFPVPRGQFWDMGAREYIPNIACFAIGHDDGDIKVNLQSGTLTYVITSILQFSIITFSEDQTDIRMGIGNEVIDASNIFPDRCFLTRKLSANSYIVADKRGVPIPPRNGSVNSIVRPFRNLHEASLQLDTGDYLGSKDLVSLSVRVRLTCYDDGPSPISEEGALFFNYNTDVDHNFIVKTPSDINIECNESQRHTGRFDGGGYKLSAHVGSSNPDALRVNQVRHVEILGLMLSTANPNGRGLNVGDVQDSTVAYNIITDCPSGGMRYKYVFGQGLNHKDQIYNNLVYNCGCDGIYVESVSALTLTEESTFNNNRSITAVQNNTVVNCRRSIVFNKSDNFYSDVAHIKNNVCQDSQYKDMAVYYYNRFANLISNNNIASDASTDVLPNNNIRNSMITFVDRNNGNFYLDPANDAIAIDNAEDISQDLCFPFLDDIVGNERDSDDWDIGAFENVDIIGEGSLSVGPVIIVGVGTEGSDPETFEIYLRESGPGGSLDDNFIPTIDPEYQFISIDDFGGDPNWEINAYLATKPTIDNLVIHVHGNREFEGTFELLARTSNLTVTIKTYEPEASEGPASLIYDGPLVDDVSDQGELILEGIKVYSTDAATQSYLVNTTAATDKVRLINSIVQVNNDSVLGGTTGYVQAINSIIVYRNGTSESTMTLVENDDGGNLLANSIVVSYFAGDLSFATNPTPVGDEIYNSMSYNYEGNSFDFANLPSKMFNNLDNTDPLFTNATLGSQLFTISTTMQEAFLPTLESPIVDTGSTSFTPSDKDIVGNNRIYISGKIDIGPYELLVNQIFFTAENIQSVYQDKLRINYGQEQFDPVYGDKTFKDLYSQFTEASVREDFVRESNVIIELKRIVADRRFFTDKENVELTRFEAYFDLSAQSIVVGKNNESIGKLLSTFFDDGRYVFFFDEVAHEFIVYLNDTYNKGLSGKRNVVNNVRFGGTSTVSV
jgi:hypothetical protein